MFKENPCLDVNFNNLQKAYFRHWREFEYGLKDNDITTVNFIKSAKDLSLPPYTENLITSRL